MKRKSAFSSGMHHSCTIRSSNHRDSTSMAARSEAYNHVKQNGGSNQAATEAYVSGNVHATENAKAVGNI